MNDIIVIMDIIIIMDIIDIIEKIEQSFSLFSFIEFCDETLCFCFGAPGLAAGNRRTRGSSCLYLVLIAYSWIGAVERARPVELAAAQRGACCGRGGGVARRGACCRAGAGLGRRVHLEAARSEGSKRRLAARDPKQVTPALVGGARGQRLPLGAARQSRAVDPPGGGGAGGGSALGALLFAGVHQEAARGRAPGARWRCAGRPLRALAHRMKIAALRRFFRAEPASSPKAMRDRLRRGHAVGTRRRAL